ncbi:hypothetical protein ACFYPH_31145, partial [Micromonospora sp. NPDC005252]|uniref:hypothetical protein n=1 Tax=Micromonospora sp. NPDC005252 TaxID=3364228 RepID=UPI0036C0432A
MKGEQKITEPYGIAVANIAMQPDGKRRWSDDEKEHAQDINDSFLAQVESGLKDDQGKVGVGRTCDRSIQPDAHREQYLSEVQNKLNAELAVSLTLTPSGQRIEVEIELSIGSRGGWNEAQELADYYEFRAGTIGDSLEVRASLSKASVGELLTPYIRMLRAIASYANSQYAFAIDILKNILATAESADDLKKLAFVLKGNAEGRLNRPGSVDRAAAEFNSALAIDSSYARAILGLAEIDYQKGLSAISHAGPKCEGKLTPQAKGRLDASIGKYESVYAAAATSRVPDVDVRAKFGTGRTYACMLRLGDSSKAEAAVRDLKYVTEKFESDRKETWLRPLASGAYGELALIYCSQRRREDALANFDKAYDWAVDGARAEEYDDARKTISGNGSYCS